MNTEGKQRSHRHCVRLPSPQIKLWVVQQPDWCLMQRSTSKPTSLIMSPKYLHFLPLIVRSVLITYGWGVKARIQPLEFLTRKWRTAQPLLFLLPLFFTLNFAYFHFPSLSSSSPPLFILPFQWFMFTSLSSSSLTSMRCPNSAPPCCHVLALMRWTVVLSKCHRRSSASKRTHNSLFLLLLPQKLLLGTCL